MRSSPSFRSNAPLDGPVSVRGFAGRLASQRSFAGFDAGEVRAVEDFGGRVGVWAICALWRIATEMSPRGAKTLAIHKNGVRQRVGIEGIETDERRRKHS